MTKERCRVWLIALATGWRCLMTPVSFLQGKERYNFPNPNPFVEDDMDKNEIASVAYRYASSLVPPPYVGGASGPRASGDQRHSFFLAVTAGGSSGTTSTSSSAVSTMAS